MVPLGLWQDGPLGSTLSFTGSCLYNLARKTAVRSQLADGTIEQRVDLGTPPTYQLRFLDIGSLDPSPQALGGQGRLDTSRQPDGFPGPGGSHLPSPGSAIKAIDTPHRDPRLSHDSAALHVMLRALPSPATVFRRPHDGPTIIVGCS